MKCATPGQGAWPFSGELACHAVQPRSLARQTACEARQGRANRGLEEIGSQVGRRLKRETRGLPKRAEYPAAIVP